jgi:hypothetical protein
MIEQRELISICRQIGSMMEAGVDILRATRVLRAQTDNPRLLNAYDLLDHNLRMGRSLAEAMEQVPDLFSPFAVSLVRQGEARNDIAGAFYRIADFLQKEDEVAVTHQHGAAANGASATTSANRYATVTPSTILPVWVIDDLISRVQVAALRIFTVAAGLLLTLAAVWASVEAGFVERRWQNVVLCSVAALFIGGAGMWLRRRIEEDSRREQERRRALELKAAHALDTPRAESAGVLGVAIAPSSNGVEPARAPREATFE